MNIGFKQISVSLLVMLGATDAFAGPGAIGWSQFVPPFLLQRTAVDRADQRNEALMGDPDERRRNGDFGRQDTSDFGTQGNNQQNNDNFKKQGRMSPEERRALRRQIDEAGHDIYRPRR